ncbi:precorrin-2 C(20)-methyltransferase [Paenibacillus jilunlii]|uniref:Precorrin-2/cobalt-factor-2 C20-methyltransferase n=1 Tax=Paenibacillus jilunlii TaxID=682956 RepID=A0A1G9Q242_9BACL|nr:precorrin-2 C(20)-methyltransferase [Paenibacillus jilunlii]SDM05122.1 precorrin-2/cobalt-factor-2 C20-methyltransferase [Paenibacillus jilunlii]
MTTRLQKNKTKHQLHSMDEQAAHEERITEAAMQTAVEAYHADDEYPLVETELAPIGTGTLYGVGVGPGDPELITLKACRLLRECPVIAYPATKKGGKSYAHEIVEMHIKADEKVMLGLVFPMTKDPGLLVSGWNRTAELCWNELKQGRDVAFVTEGDPNLYSTFIHLARLMQELHPGVPVVSIPGISSVLGAAAALGQPLADGDQRVGIIPATEDREALKEALLHHDTVVFLKVAKVLDLLLDVLDELGLAGKASVVTKVTSPNETVWRDARDLRGQELEYLSLMVVSK